MVITVRIMNRTIIYSLAILALAGCQMEEPEFITKNSKHFTATIEDSRLGNGTKTSLDEQGNVRWKQGDQVSIFAGSTVNERYQVSDDSDGKTTAVLDKVSGTVSESGNEIANNVAFYPYVSSPSLYGSGYSYSINNLFLPAEQNYAADSFGNGAFPMVAVTSSTDDMNLKFKNILGGLKLQLKGTASITSISVTSNNGESLCGYADVTAPLSGAPSIYLSGSCMSVVLDCGAGVQLDAETPTSFIIALPPITMTGGFTVVVTDTEGKQMEIKTTKPQTINRSMLLRMPPVEYVGTADELDYSNEPFTITSHGSTAVAIVSNDSPKAISLEYKKGNGAWTEYTIVDRNDFYYNNQVIGDPIELADGETLQFRAGEEGNDTFSHDRSQMSTMQAYYNVEVIGSGTVDASGNVMSLVDRSMQRTSLDSYMFHGLFFGCTKLVDASNLKLPATTLASHCYTEMFHACQGLVSAPELPATTLANKCYYGMFDGCYNLTTAPDLPATELASNCYEAMFYYCRSLTMAPELPAIKLAYECYKGMFLYCSSLTTAPELPAANLNYQSYTEMFKGCSSLNYVKANFVTDPNSKLSRDLFNWLYGVSYSGTFVKNAAAKWDVRGSSGVPEGWTIVYDDADLGLPSIGNPVIQQVDYTFATIMSTVDSDGGHAISSCGFYYGTSEDAINTWSRVTGYVSGDFSKEITGLTRGTTYYVKAYATNEVGTIESDVVSFTTESLAYYENGHNCGDGIEIVQKVGNIEKTVIWAPVNLGYYDMSNDKYSYGRFYQWGRVAGQGYAMNMINTASGDLYTYTDENGKTVHVKVNRELPLNSPEPNTHYSYTEFTQWDYEENDYYTVTSDDWYGAYNDAITSNWNEIQKDGYIGNPCPDGWRVPLFEELCGLVENKSSFTTVNGQSGYYFYGLNNNGNRVFLPACGTGGPNPSQRGQSGYYWSSNPYDGVTEGGEEYFYSRAALYMRFSSSKVTTSEIVTSWGGGYSWEEPLWSSRNWALSIRCVKE